MIHAKSAVKEKKSMNSNTILLLLTIGLARRLDSPRVAVEPYPNRWTHHVILSEVGQLDSELMDWLQEAHDFALTK